MGKGGVRGEGKGRTEEFVEGRVEWEERLKGGVDWTLCDSERSSGNHCDQLLSGWVTPILSVLSLHGM